MARKKGIKEFDEVQKLKHENKKLRRENSKLRKVIKNVDFERYSFVQDLLTSVDYENDKESIKQTLEEKWKCYKCGIGILRLIILFKMNKEHYFRKCDNCGKRTKLKEYTKTVEGIK